MNLSRTIRVMAAILAAGAVAGCSAGSQFAATAPPVPGAAGQAVTRGESVSRSGRPVLGASRVRLPAILPTGIHAPRGRRDLFVSLPSDVLILRNGTWKNAGTISGSAMACPNGNWMDRKGNLYVSDYDCGGSNVPGIYEYKRGASQPSFVYSAGLSDPVNVTTDRRGNVYAMDFYGFSITEYPQGSNTPLHQCAPPNSAYSYVIGAAVDRHGNVFVASTEGSAPWSTDLYEYVGGLQGCSATQLALFPGLPGGMILDKKGNLLVASQIDNVINVVPPPYTAVGSQIGAVNPFMITLDRCNDRLYVTSWDYDGAPGSILIDAYPSGTNVVTLGASNGVANPSGAVDTLNYVP